MVEEIEGRTASLVWRRKAATTIAGVEKEKENADRWWKKEVWFIQIPFFFCEKWLEVVVPVAFSAVPLTLYVPPVRSLNLFVQTMEDLWRESSGYTNRVYPRVRYAFRRLLDCMLCNTAR
ncbi:hypothetical protein LXL04_010841 [Taraxacum kok-saghyz]